MRITTEDLASADVQALLEHHGRDMEEQSPQELRSLP